MGRLTPIPEVIDLVPKAAANELAAEELANPSITTPTVPAVAETEFAKSKETVVEFAEYAALIPASTPAPERLVIALENPK